MLINQQAIFDEVWNCKLKGNELLNEFVEYFMLYTHLRGPTVHLG